LQTGKGAEGTGLGLAITQRLVELQGGRLGLESQVGRGSCFYFSLPAGGAPRKPRVRGTRTAERMIEKPLVLVVEDDPAAAQLISSQLTSAGYQALLCDQPTKAVETAADLQPHAITLDILMKPMNGFEVLLHLKNDERTKNIPVIVLTIVDQAAVGTSLGAEEYLVKPVEKATLLAAIKRCLVAQGIQTAARPILVVEDDAPTREIVTDMLTAAGYAVVTAADGEQARAWIAATLPEVVILDLVLPKVSGFELLAEWRADPRTADLPVFILTSKDLNEIEEKYLRTHAESLFRKQQAWQKDFLQQLERVVGQPRERQP
jgi:DNA-binding response OmpR family regulator